MKDFQKMIAICAHAKTWEAAGGLIPPEDALEAIRETVVVTESVQARTTAIPIPVGLHPITTTSLLGFAAAIAEKMRRNEEKYGYSDTWFTEDWEELFHQEHTEHIQKGDPLDNAIYNLFAWVRGWKTRLVLPDLAEPYRRIAELEVAREYAMHLHQTEVGALQERINQLEALNHRHPAPPPPHPGKRTRRNQAFSLEPACALLEAEGSATLIELTRCACNRRVVSGIDRKRTQAALSARYGTRLIESGGTGKQDPKRLTLVSAQNLPTTPGTAEKPAPSPSTKPSFAEQYQAVLPHVSAIVGKYPNISVLGLKQELKQLGLVVETDVLNVMLPELLKQWAFGTLTPATIAPEVQAIIDRMAARRPSLVERATASTQSEFDASIGDLS